MKKKVHIWDFIEKAGSTIVVDINPKIKNKIKLEFNSPHKIVDELNNSRFAKKNKIILVPARWYEWFIFQESYPPLWVICYLNKKMKRSINEIEQNIIIYKQKHVPKINSIKNPKLPLKIDPLLTSFVAHLFFDGSLPKDGKGVYYNQKSQTIAKNVINNVKFVFGDVYYSIKKDHREVLKCRFPRIIGETCKSVYNIKSFGTKDSRISKLIFELNEEHKLAFLISAILDEGSIAYDGSIIFGVANKQLCKDMKKLCISLDLKTTSVKRKSGDNFYYFYIKSIRKFYEKIKLFSKKYPSISLHHKELRLKKALEIKSQPYQYTVKFAEKRKNLLIRELVKSEKTINELSSKLLIPPRTIRRYFKKLIKEKKINRYKKSVEYYYFLPH